MATKTPSIKNVPVGCERVGESLFGASPTQSHWQSLLRRFYVIVAIFFLLVNYFLAQFDKFILSYFQTSFTADLNLSPTQYGVLSGYATGIAYALLALPIAYLADHAPTTRVWVLSLASLWWSLCVIFQGLSHSFWQVLLARIAMGIGQSVVAPLSVSLISDLLGNWRDVFFGCSIFYVGVYIGEAISGQIASAFDADVHAWRLALKAIGIVGIIVAVLIRAVLREPQRRPNIFSVSLGHDRCVESPRLSSRWGSFRDQLHDTFAYLARMRSFWLLVLSASFRQISGNVFGYYMPTYLSNTYPMHHELLSRYGIIVGVVGSVSVLAGGLASQTLWRRTRLIPIYMTAIGGMLSSVFVLLVVFSRDLAGSDSSRGIAILYGCLSAAYLTAETWLGAMDALVASLLPPSHKTFGLAVWSSVQTLVYSSGPEIIGLALRSTDTASSAYLKDLQVVLAVVISVGYWIAGAGFLLSIPLLASDLKGSFLHSTVSAERESLLALLVGIVALLVIALFTVSIVYSVR